MTARENPFAPARLEKLLAFDPALVGHTWESLEERWAALGDRAAITGKHGAGKSSLLRAWAERLEDRGCPTRRFFFNEQHRRLSHGDRAKLEDCTGCILIVDGEEHLPWRERRELRHAAKNAAGVILARHTRGPWQELIRLKSDATLAAKLLQRAVPEEAASYLPGLEKRLARHSGNLRELWFSLYDEVSKAH